ncbi:nuclear speckle splicing regulatory protein 1 isoform X2 [Adelges cooleyi]|uniref:nuclear speckle splicing regulatory protein 1 isoform X2 n=1 Tax=Adelges cooleyi TaxID=133065 RepID=UPI00217F4F04|nr:nuclear speckle splicing regulatory protein 1 isoform X2 [Adelges cooleyi]XP_050442109.1 nuclear speckle splicing regulatory protein 1 isoform X2 [Adelges cooleyi]
MTSNTKRYGLTVPKKKLNEPMKLRNVFGDDSDSDENQTGKKVIQTQNRTKAQERSANIVIDKALEEDSTVFQYDEVYDEMEKKKGHLDSKKKKEVDKKPRYIENLIAQAEKRKIEYERRNERMIQKEREAEGDEFKDKEAFVTSSYKKKLEEMKKMDEDDLKLSMIEDINDVTKQRDMGSFYRHLYKAELCKDENVAEEKMITKVSETSRQYRKRASSESSNSSVANDDKDDTDMSNSDSSSDSPKRKKKSDENGPEEGEIIEDKPADLSSTLKDKIDEPETTVKAEADTIKKDKKEKKESKPKEPKRDIWKKRTVGDAFIAAQQRYFERKANGAILQY